MEELIRRVEILKDALDKQLCIKRIKKLNEEIKQNHKLMEMIHHYTCSYDDSLKEKIYKEGLFQEYKEAETDVNILILSINSQLNKIRDKGSCQL